MDVVETGAPSIIFISDDFVGRAIAVRFAPGDAPDQIRAQFHTAAEMAVEVAAIIQEGREENAKRRKRHRGLVQDASREAKPGAGLDAATLGARRQRQD